MAATLEFEQAAGDVVMGIDEAGRGPLVGGVYAAAVSVPLARAVELLDGAWRGVNDSKKLTERRREALAEVIKTTPGCTWCVASASYAEIDRLNILRATHLAMRRAALGVAGRLYPPLADLEPGRPLPETPWPLGILVDGLPVPTLPFPSRNIVKGDAKSLFIAAASILAKTARDADCLRLETLYPGYGFAQNKGYPTPAHLAALKRLGPCPEHRRSFGPVAQMTLF
ncbi:MAG: ribonuclease HII [Kiritimatiellia bacterium]